MFYIRTDANERVASGHVMRCLTIAEAIRRRGEPCTFLCADENARQLIEERGFSFWCLESEWNHLDREIETMRRLVRRRRITKLLVDTYYVTPYYFESLNQDLSIIYLDDEARCAYPVDAVINYGAQAAGLPYRQWYGEQKTALLLGPAYIPIRPEFSFGGIPIRPVPENLLITTGGSDPCHAAERLAGQLVRQRELANIRIHIVCGRFYDNREALLRLSHKNGRIRIHENVTDMGSLMRGADLAVSAGGTTLYELCACGVPTVCFTFADNQTAGARELNRLGALFYAGDLRENREEGISLIANALTGLCKNPELRGKRSEIMRRLVDGNGAERIAEYCMHGNWKDKR